MCASVCREGWSAIASARRFAEEQQLSDTARYALVLALTSAVALGAVLVNRLSARLGVPAPVWMLAAAAVAVQLIPGMPTPPDSVVAQIVTVALVLILFDGGRHIGWSRLRPALVPIIVVGVLGTFLTAAGSGVLLHLGFGLAWYLALLVGTAVSPTDPAVVFSVLGRQEIAGRSGTILEGESGANDPVGIALDGWVAGRWRSERSRPRRYRNRVRAADGDRSGCWPCGRNRPAGVHAPGLASQRGPVPAANPRQRPPALRRDDICCTGPAFWRSS